MLLYALYYILPVLLYYQKYLKESVEMSIAVGGQVVSYLRQSPLGYDFLRLVKGDSKSCIEFTHLFLRQIERQHLNLLNAGTMS